MKFDTLFSEKFPDYVHTVQSVRDLCDNCGRQLSAVVKENMNDGACFYVTAIQFTRINLNAIDCILNTIRAGHIAESIVLLRWHLESAHLFYHLWKNEGDYQKWREGKRIRPSDIRAFFQSCGLNTWKSTYEDWSNVTHCNSSYVEHCYGYDRAAPASDAHVILVGKVLVNLMWTGHKVNHVSGNLLKVPLDVAIYNPIATRYNELEEQIETATQEQIEAENNFMKSADK